MENVRVGMFEMRKTMGRLVKKTLKANGDCCSSKPFSLSYFLSVKRTML